MRLKQIAGANSFGIDSLLIANGIHKYDLNQKGILLPQIELKKFFQRQNMLWYQLRFRGDAAH